MMRQYTAYALLPFNTPYDFVFDCIKRAAESMQHEGLHINMQSASQYLETKGSKVVEIRKQISQADFLVIDFSARTSNVMWEFGFAQAMDKHIIALDSSSESSPFNIAETDKITYTLSKQGLGILEEELRRAFRRTVTSISAESSWLRLDTEVQRLRSDLDECLSATPSASITRKLVTNELERITHRVTSIKSNYFDLRNVKPAKEVIDYYSDYLSQLDGDCSSFSTITYVDFWMTITDHGRNWKYLEANKLALERGATIRRVFILSKESIEVAHAKCGDVIERVLDEHKKWLDGEHGDRLEAHVIEARSRQEERGYPNIGLLRRLDECLFFSPQYDERRRMESTRFYYSKGDIPKRVIRTAEADFETARRQALDLIRFLDRQSAQPNIGLQLSASAGS
ncbi:MAG: hypothetical protein MRJ68_08525 [Nitrospira sp.]|nr:hypothetical protein [Nitrospira sp.]